MCDGVTGLFYASHLSPFLPPLTHNQIGKWAYMFSWPWEGLWRWYVCVCVFVCACEGERRKGAEVWQEDQKKTGMHSRPNREDMKYMPGPLNLKWLHVSITCIFSLGLSPSQWGNMDRCKETKQEDRKQRNMFKRNDTSVCGDGGRRSQLGLLSVSFNSCGDFWRLMESCCLHRLSDTDD